ncbi:hypothetical protein BDK51DRAFT_51475 [Blyttiomyces helicus]|uniref:Uncharacterized protein n=1 Tax=Blyttiomyces helicus TaxID=388810 RepID=A0A4P9WKF6_9FUNG|nr:hypothetical protein BDK51DRAFT_51475 [Blyttiomyces helicus]|eukprot:RKO92882.1 hypothetical protein BDK51DRAFT_51475 [Blyttiomyces helicus]
MILIEIDFPPPEQLRRHRDTRHGESGAGLLRSPSPTSNESVSPRMMGSELHSPISVGAFSPSEPTMEPLHLDSTSPFEYAAFPSPLPPSPLFATEDICSDAVAQLLSNFALDMPYSSAPSSPLIPALFEPYPSSASLFQPEWISPPSTLPPWVLPPASPPQSTGITELLSIESFAPDSPEMSPVNTLPFSLLPAPAVAPADMAFDHPVARVVATSEFTPLDEWEDRWETRLVVDRYLA